MSLPGLGVSWLGAGSVRFLRGLVAPAGILPAWMTPARKDVAMKKTCFVLLCALLLSLAPTTLAADGDGIAAIGQLLDQLISFLTGLADEPETGELFPPNGEPESSVEEPEIGEGFPPGG